MELSRFVKADRHPVVQKVNTFFGVGEGLPGFLIVGVFTVLSLIVGLSGVAFWWLFLTLGIAMCLGTLKYASISLSDIDDCYLEKAYPLLGRITDPERRAVANALFDEIFDCAKSQQSHYSCGILFSAGDCDERIKALRKLADKPKENKALERAKELFKKEEEDRKMYESIMKELGERA